MESRLDQVVLYPQSARLTYLLDDTPESSEAVLVLAAVGGKVDWTSLRARVTRGAGKVEVLRRLSPSSRAAEPAEGKAEKRTLLEEQFRQVEAWGQVLLGRPQPKPAEGIEPESGLQVMRDGRQALAEAEDFVQQKLAEIDQELHRIPAASQPGPRQPSIAVHLSGCAGPIQVELSFLTGSAGWKPLYELALDGRLGKNGEFCFAAEIYQTTGQHWEQVKLTFSTAPPPGQAQLPQLDSFLYRPTPPPPQEDFRQVWIDPGLYSDYKAFAQAQKPLGDPQSYLTPPPVRMQSSGTFMPRTGQGRGRRPIFCCQECDEVFVDEESLKLHSATHSRLEVLAACAPARMSRKPESVVGLSSLSRTVRPAKPRSPRLLRRCWWTTINCVCAVRRKRAWANSTESQWRPVSAEIAPESYAATRCQNA